MDFERAFEQLKLDSQEIEAELEAELAARTQLCEQAQAGLDRAETDRRQTLAKNTELEARIRDLEDQIEEYQESLRIKDGFPASARDENHRLLEKLALAEVDRSETHALAAELQRAKQEAEDAQEEVRNLQRRAAN